MELDAKGIPGLVFVVSCEPPLERPIKLSWYRDRCNQNFEQYRINERHNTEATGSQEMSKRKKHRKKCGQLYIRGHFLSVVYGIASCISLPRRAKHQRQQTEVSSTFFDFLNLKARLRTIGDGRCTRATGEVAGIRLPNVLAALAFIAAVAHTDCFAGVLKIAEIWLAEINITQTLRHCCLRATRMILDPDGIYPNTSDGLLIDWENVKRVEKLRRIKINYIADEPMGEKAPRLNRARQKEQRNLSEMVKKVQLFSRV
ncbi:hypothetical protein T265_02962 [Opisthorchis viverrini]|uniref:Uncharacterized protein n=1 Tax=Opisthorchis viverrini TaxID=6198 RepID=A0A074ZXF5_OPIVI|nr:hypothetical protein T265_02962 [Opisthorchis viverrini]KER30607.1 hypothetical protein T265_02962 [Opisthorchis viverrini]